jgi:hypothetical protein
MKLVRIKSSNVASWSTVHTFLFRYPSQKPSIYNF